MAGMVEILGIFDNFYRNEYELSWFKIKHAEIFGDLDCSFRLPRYPLRWGLAEWKRNCIHDLDTDKEARCLPNDLASYPSIAVQSDKLSSLCRMLLYICPAYYQVSHCCGSSD